MTDVLPIEYQIYSPSLGDKVRIVINHEGVLRPFFWFKTAKDGSVYLGPRTKNNLSGIQMGDVVVDGEGQTRLAYSTGSQVTNPSVLKDPHVSLHASGIVHSGGEKFYLKKTLSSTGQQALCIVLFQEIKTYIPVKSSQIKQKDVCLNYPLDEERPLVAQIFTSRLDNIKPVRIPSATYQINMIFTYKDIPGVGDAALQFVLYHGVKGLWPPGTYMVLPIVTEEELKAAQKP